MKKIILMNLWFACQVLFANTPYTLVTGKYTEKKEIRKEFEINEMTSLFISNQYGTITIVTNPNNTNTLSIDVKIKVSSNNKDQVQKRLNEINIDFSQTHHKVSAKTNIPKTRYFFNFFNFNYQPVQMQIDYVVSLPVNNKMRLENQYGDIFLNNTMGDLQIDIDYGSVHIEQAQKATIQMDYSPNSSIKNINQLWLSADYSKIHIEQADQINSQCDYSSLNINKVNKLVGSNDYGKVHIQSIQEGDIQTEYCPISLGKVHKKLTLHSEYGSVSIDKIMPEATQIKINSEYSTVSVQYDALWNFNYFFSNQYASIKTPQHLTPKLRKETHTNISEEGSKGTSNHTFEIHSQYGNVKIKELDSKK